MTMLRKATARLLSRRLPRTTTSILVAAVIALPAGVGTAIAVADSGNTSAVAINTADGSSVFKLSFGVRQVSGSVVDPQNAAVAISSCANCQTVAISVEVALARVNATMVAPVNEAIAINENCTSCDTLAEAYQFVIAIGTQLKLTAVGHQQLAEIRQQLEQLRNSGLSIEDISAQVSQLMGTLSNVVNNQLIGVNDPAAGPGAPTAAATPSSSSPGASAPTNTTSTPTDTTTSPASAPTDTTSTPADTTSSGTTGTTGPTSTSPTSTTPTTTTTTP